MNKNKWIDCMRLAFMAGSVAMTAVLPLSAEAHALLVKAEPARRAALVQVPRELKLWFNEEIEPAYTKLAVLDAAGKSVTDAKFGVPADNRKLMVLALPALDPGKYTVKFRVLSVDGHVVESAYDFVLKGNAPKK